MTFADHSHVTLNIFQREYIKGRSEKKNQIKLLSKVEKTFKDAVNQYYKVYYETFKPRFNDHSYRFLIGSADKKYFEATCSTKPYLLVQVHSAPGNIKNRLSIRFSWGKQNNTFNLGRTKISNANYHTVFVVGRSYSKHVNNAVLAEAAKFKDVIVTNFIDSYRSLSNKTIYFLRWSNTYCLPTFMLKTDDDCYVNVPNIIDYLQKSQVNDLYVGRVQWYMPANRDEKSKFYIPETLYSKVFLPPYVSGGGYLISGHLIPRLLNSTEYFPTIPNEDANVGILMNSINVLPSEHTRMLPYIYCNESVWNRPTCDFLHPFVIHGIENYGQIWIHYHIQLLSQLSGICKQSFKSRHRLKIPLYCPTDNT